MKNLYFFLFVCLMLEMNVFDVQSQNLLAGWDNTSGTPYDASWRVDGSVSVTWGTLNGSGNRFRTNVGSPANNGTDPMLYITSVDTKFGYPVTPVAGKFYQLSGKAWRRNGASGSATFNFYIANNLLATNPVSKISLTLSGNNVTNTFSGLQLVVPASFTSGYFLWDVHVNSGSWADAGVWLLNLTELGNAIPVTFDTGGGNTIATQYFLEGESYKISKPADPSKADGSPFAGWYADSEFNTPFDFSIAVTTATTLYAKWEDASVIKAQLEALITAATSAKTGGTAIGQTYLQSAIDAAQAVVNESASTISEYTMAIDKLNTALAVYHDNSLSNLTVAGVILADFSATTYKYSYDIDPGGSAQTVSATATEAAIATVAITQAPTVPGTATVVVTAGDGSTKTYTVNFRINYMSAWDGNGMGTTTDIPGAFGWVCSSSVTWTSADNSNDTYAYRYRDNFGNGVGRVITHPVNNNVFSFPVTLTGGKMYNFTCRNSNINNTCTAMFGINTSRDATGTMLKSQSLTSAKWSALTTFNFNFVVEEPGTYYMVWQTTNGTDRNIATDFLITEIGDAFSVTFDTDGGSTITTQYFAEGESYTVVEPAEPTKSGYIFTGWYADDNYTSLFNFNSPVTESITVYAHFVLENNPTITNIVINDDIVSIQAAKYMNITVNGNSELHISADKPIIGSVINLTSDNAWLYLESLKPSKVISDYLSYININGQDFDPETDRIAIYGGGAVIIPNGKETAKHALTVYLEADYGGSSMQFEQDKYYRTAELSAFDNNIRSFKLKKGYSCTFANNPDGTGFSRVFIASDADIEVPVMPEGLEFVSFVRVFRWEWVSKKGWAGGGSPVELTNSTWFNDWAAGGTTNNPDYEYVPMRHNLGWDSFNLINSRTNVSHVLGYNEPDHTDQANCTPEQAIRQWPELFKSGLRLGSPTPDAIRKQWLVDFLAMADSLNYRVDFVVGHMYWNSQSGQNLYNGVVDACTRLYGNRPMWITEWNNGANWTSEGWPTASGAKRDADLNIIYDEGGNEITVTRPLSPENAAKQAAWILDALDGLDRCEWLERHSLYNWVQDARSMVLGDKLTPAGKNFAAYKSKVAFSKTKEYIHTWKIAPPLPSYTLSDDYQSININWYDHNGETGKYYVLERKFDNETEYSVVSTLYAGTDYEYGSKVTCNDAVTLHSADYRVRAMSYKDTPSAYSRIISFTLDPNILTPTGLQGTAISSSIIDLSWTPVSGARSYNLKRSTAIDGTYETIASFLAEALYRDDALTVNTTYYYKVSAISNRGETADSEPISVTTKAITVPEQLTGLFASAGDTQAVLTWDYLYDALFRVYRSNSEDGIYVKIADNIADTRYVDKNLVNGQTYYYKITSFNTAGETVANTILSVTPILSQYAYFDFDENEGSTAYDLWGGYHATLYNNATRVSGKTNTAVSFTAANQSYVHMRDGLTSELNDFTISLWVNYTSKGSRIFDFGESTSVFMMLSPGLRYKITCPAGTYDVTATGNTLPTGQWTHLALTQAGTTFKMYMNGVEIFSDNNATVKPSDMGTNTQNFLVKSHWGSDSYSTCLLDEFRIYNRALDADEVNELVNCLEIPAGTILNVSNYTDGNIIFYSDNDATGQLTDASNLQVNGIVKVVKTFNVDEWYPIGFPFEIDTVIIKQGANVWGGVIYNEDNGSQTYDHINNATDDNYFVKYYDGAGNVFKFTDHYEANKGYIVEFPSDPFSTGSTVTAIFKSVTNPVLYSSNGTIGEYDASDYTFVVNPNVANISSLTNAINYYQYDYANHFRFTDVLTQDLKPFEAVVVHSGQGTPRRVIGAGGEVTKLTGLGNDFIESIRYYNLQGVEIPTGTLHAIPPQGGIYIVKTIYKSGKISVSKIIK